MHFAGIEISHLIENLKYTQQVKNLHHGSSEIKFNSNAIYPACSKNNLANNTAGENKEEEPQTFPREQLHSLGCKYLHKIRHFSI